MTYQGSILRTSVLALGLAAASCTAVAEPGAARPRTVAGGFRISGPYAHKNLELFLIHGEDRLKGSGFLTLQEALEQKKVRVHETGAVNELAVENVTPDQKVYIQSGDIVKGGRQDRVIAYDFVVPPRSGRVPIASFCVEQGRWSARGGEMAELFGSSADQVASKGLKIAARQSGDQAEVWSSVSEVQAKLSANVGASVRSPSSESSLQLALEHGKLRETAEGYIKALSHVTEGRSDVIGYAFGVNGKLNSAEVYASSALFRKLWPKLLKASAVEAIAEFEKDKGFASLTARAVEASIADAEGGKATEKQVAARVRMITRETPNGLLFETRVDEDDDAWLHRSYVVK